MWRNKCFVKLLSSLHSQTRCKTRFRSDSQVLGQTLSLRGFKNSVPVCQIDVQHEKGDSTVQGVIGGKLSTFQSDENVYLHQIMENLPRYQDSIITSSDLKQRLGGASDLDKEEIAGKDWTSLTDDQLVEDFQTVTRFAFKEGMCLSESNFTPMCTALAGRLSSLPSLHLLEFGKLFSLWHPTMNTRAENFQPLFKALDSAFVDNYGEWIRSRNFSNILQAADIFYWLSLGQLTHYLRYIAFHALQKTKKPENIIQLVFYLNIMRNVPSTYKAYEVESKLCRIMDQCSIDEMAVAAGGLYKVKKALQNPSLASGLLKITASNAATVHERTLNLLTKALRGTVHPENSFYISEMQATLLPRVNDMSLDALVRVLQLGTHHNVINEDFAAQVMNKALITDEVRVKHMWLLLFCLTEYEIPSLNLKPLAEHFLCKLRGEKKREKLDFYARTLQMLLVCGVLPHDLVDEVFRSDVSDPLLAFLVIDIHLEMFYPDYDGARLQPENRERIFNHWFGENGKFRIQYAKADTFNTRECLEWVDAFKCALKYNPDCYLITQLVPSNAFHDVLICKDKNGELLPIPEIFHQYKPWELKRIPRSELEEGKQFISISFLARDHLRSGQPSAVFDHKRYQRFKIQVLSKLGYHPILVNLSEWARKNKSSHILGMLEKRD